MGTPRIALADAEGAHPGRHATTAAIRGRLYNLHIVVTSHHASRSCEQSRRRGPKGEDGVYFCVHVRFE
eukprot:7387997-Prymnesium_polylepis.1